VTLASSALWLALATAAAPAQVTLGTWPTNDSRELAPELIELDIGSYRHKGYGELSRRRAITARHGSTLTVDLRRLTLSRDAVKRAYRRCSFAIDCDEPSVRRLRPALETKSGKRATPSEIARFVSGYIVSKNLARGLDLPSTTAVRREGDCTEHAMLTVALARLAGYPARVIFGLALVEDFKTSSKTAFGHAWAEIHDGRRWSLLDAALMPGAPPAAKYGKHAAACVAYIPVQIVDKEGPEFPGTGGFHPTLIRSVGVSSRPIRNAGVCSPLVVEE
jgi:hypothetical protein